MNKLPTAEEICIKYLMCNQFYTPDPRALKAMEEHTRLHTEALRQENERLKEALKDIGSYKDEAFIHPHQQVLAKSISLLALEVLKGEKP